MMIPSSLSILLGLCLIGAEPVGAEPVGAEPVGAEPVGAEPVGAEPVGAEPVGAEPVGAEWLVDQPPTYDPQVQRDEVPSDCYQRLAQIESLLQANESDAAIASLQRLQEEQGHRLIAAPNQPLNPDFPVIRYVPFRTFAAGWQRSWQSTYPASWMQYRQSLDNAIEQRMERLSKAPWMVEAFDWEEAMSSLHRSRAMLALAALAWERGRIQEARAHYQRVAPGMRIAVDQGAQAHHTPSIPWYYLLQHIASDEWPVELTNYWQTQLEHLTSVEPSATPLLAEAWAGLIRCSLAEGDLRRAKLEQRLLERFFGNVPSSYAKQTWCEVTRTWIEQAGDTEPSSLGVRALPFDVQPLWHQLLPKRFASRDQEYAMERVAETDDGWLVYYPQIVGAQVFVNLFNRVEAFDLKTGNRWPPNHGSSTLFDTRIADADLLPLSYPIAGIMRGTLNVEQNILYARVGSPLTAWNTRSGLGNGSASSIVAIDLAQEGRLVSGYPLRLTGEIWSGCELEGTPLVIDDSLYVGITSRTSLQVRRWVACFERSTGRFRWRSPMLAAGALDGMEDKHWISHHQVVHRDGRLFYDTGLGSIVALNAGDGKVAWLIAYPRVQIANESATRSTAYRSRDLATLQIVGDLVLCAPSDCREIFALDWGTGDLIWASDPEEVSGAIHLLGQDGEVFFAGGERLYAMDLATGRVLDQFPEEGEGARLLGRGTLIHHHILLPQASSLVDVVWREETHRFQEVARHDLGIAFEHGANLTYDRGYVVASGSNRISLFRCDASREATSSDAVR